MLIKYLFYLVFNQMLEKIWKSRSIFGVFLSCPKISIASNSVL